MASASLLKSSPVLDKSEWVKGQTLRQPSASSVVRCLPTTPAGSYADELVKTAVSFTTFYLPYDLYIIINYALQKVYACLFVLLCSSLSIVLAPTKSKNLIGNVSLPKLNCQFELLITCCNVSRENSILKLA